MNGDPFAVLGVAPTADDDEVRAAYRSRSLLLHPDLHQDRPDHVRREADRAMAQLTEAYRAVMDERAARRPAGGRSAAGGGRSAAGAPSGSAFHRLGRLAARSRTVRLAAEAGERGGEVAHRLGWLVGRRRSG